VTMITRDQVVDVPETTKFEVAQRVLDQIVRLRDSRRSSVKA
jgi:chromosome condensin MukBEF complex kleisin-like MukF subunit